MINENNLQAADTEDLLAAVEEFENAISSLSSGLAQVHFSVRKLAAAIEEKSGLDDHAPSTQKASEPGVDVVGGSLPFVQPDVPLQKWGDRHEAETANDAERLEVSRPSDEVRHEISKASPSPVNPEPEGDNAAPDVEVVRQELQRTVERVKAEMDDGLRSVESDDDNPHADPKQTEPQSDRAEFPQPAGPTLKWPKIEREQPPDNVANVPESSAGIAEQ